MGADGSTFLYDVRPGNGPDLFSQLEGMHGAVRPGVRCLILTVEMSAKVVDIGRACVARFAFVVVVTYRTINVCVDSDAP